MEECGCMEECINISISEICAECPVIPGTVTWHHASL